MYRPSLFDLVCLTLCLVISHVKPAPIAPSTCRSASVPRAPRTHSPRKAGVPNAMCARPAMRTVRPRWWRRIAKAAKLRFRLVRASFFLLASIRSSSFRQFVIRMYFHCLSCNHPPKWPLSCRLVCVCVCVCLSVCSACLR